jgi:hypothetical protein
MRVFFLSLFVCVFSKMAADQNVREEMVFHARTHLLQEKIKFCSRREGYNAAELCYPLVQKYLQRMHRMGFVEIPESELAKIYAKDPLAVPKVRRVHVCYCILLYGRLTAFFVCYLSIYVCVPLSYGLL